MKKMFIFIMTAILSLGLFSGCGGNEEVASSGAEGSTSAEAVPTEYQKNPIITLNGFETQRNLSMLVMNNALGKITLNTDAQYVSEGKASAKLSIVKDTYWWTSGAPQIYNALINEFTGETYSDFDKVNMLSLDVFNAEERTVKVGIQLVYSSSSSGLVQWYEIEGGQKSQLTYSVTREFLPSVSTTNPMKRVIGVNFIFERLADKDCTLYLDNYRLYKTNTPIQTVSRSIAEKEIISFDYMWQYSDLQATATLSERLPKLTWVKDVVSPNQKEGAAIQVQTSDVYVEDGYASFEGVAISSACLTECDFSKFGQDEYFCFDLYSPYDGGVSEIFFSLSARNTQYFSASFANGFVPADKYPLNKGEWQTYAFKISELNSGANVTETVRFEKTNRIGFTCRTTTSKTAVFYIDNIRVESALPTGAIV